MPDWKTTIEKNPTTVILTACVAVAGVTAGCLGWFWVNSSSLKNQQHLVELANVKKTLESQISELKGRLKLENQQHLIELANVKKTLGTQISKLKGRLTSIERRNGDEKLYLDVADITIQRDGLPTLSQTHTSYGDGLFYLDPPTFSTWNEKPASQLDLIEPMLGAEIANGEFGSAAKSAMDALSNKTGVLWVSETPIQSTLSKDSVFRSTFDIKNIVSKPFVFIMPIDDKYLKNAGQVISGLVQEMNQEQDIMDRLVELLAEDDKSETETTQVSNELEQSEEEDDDEEIMKLLSKMSRGDLAGFLLTDALVSNTKFSQLLGGSVEVVSADKKGNVSYLRIYLTVPVDDGATSTETVKTILDMEYFFVGTKTGGILVRTSVPSKGFKTESYAWTQGLLTSLRVPF